MRRFLLCVFLLAILTLLYEVAVFALPLINGLREAESIYTLNDEQHILCIGASQVACSIIPAADVKILAVEQTNADAALIRLLELERRQQLKSVKFCFFDEGPLSHSRPVSPKDVRLLAQLWIREFPVNWRYLDFMPVKFGIFVEVFWAKLQYEFLHPRSAKYHLQQELDPEWTGIRRFDEHPNEWRQERIDFYRLQAYADYDFRMNSLRKNIDAFVRAKEICDRHGIVFAAFSAPVHSAYRQCIPAAALSRHHQFKEEMQRRGIPFFERMDAYDDSFLSDPVHLTYSGAVRFTDELRRFMDRVGEDRNGGN